MPSVGVTVDIRPAQNTLRTAARQIPFAAATAVNQVAFEAQRLERMNIGQTFAHPRPFTVNSVQLLKASKARLAATLFVRPEVARYLLPYETGGQHVLPGKGVALINPKDIKRDQYGQLSRSVSRIVAGRQDIFIGRITTAKGGSISGVWQRLDVTRAGKVKKRRKQRGTVYDPAHGALKLLIRFGDALPVNKHLEFGKRTEALVKAKLPAAFALAMGRAMATAR